MKNINELTNLESGKCVLIGGGLSTASFDFSKIKSEVMRIAVNRCFIDTRIDYQIFSDEFFLEWISKHPIQDARILIGHKLQINDRIDFHFDFEGCISEGFHTGYHALQIAELLGFDEIYLTGFDYYKANDKVHYYEGKFKTEITEPEKKGIQNLFKSWVKDFNRHKWTAKIYNCNPNSKLKNFSYKEVS